MKLNKLVGAITLTAAGVFSAASMAAIDPTLPIYEKTSGVSGNLSSVGSDTLANMMTLWAEEFKHIYPNVNIQIQAAGSSTAPPALTEGTSQFGPMSRKMKPNEVEAFEKHYGYQPTAVRVAIDALAVFVHKDNPITGLSIEQITYGYFKEKALCKGDFRPNVNEQPGSASVVQSVSQSLNAIGYSGIGYKTAGVKAVAISKKGDKFIEATAANAADGTYPLSRYLYVYVNKHPNKDLSPMDREFLRFVLSKQGQQIVEKDGYVPLPTSVITKDLEKVGIKL
mgnify:CR=1 FL=1